MFIPPNINLIINSHLYNLDQQHNKNRHIKHQLQHLETSNKTQNQHITTHHLIIHPTNTYPPKPINKDNVTNDSTTSSKLPQHLPTYKLKNKLTFLFYTSMLTSFNKSLLNEPIIL